MIDRHLLYDFGWGNDDFLLQYGIGSDISFSYALFFFSRENFVRLGHGKLIG